MSKFKIKISGTNTLLMHSPFGANQLNPKTKEYKAVSGKKNKTDFDHELMAQLEFEMNSYFDAKIGFYLPAFVFEESIKSGAKKNKNGKSCNIGMRILEENIPLITHAPKDLEKAFNDLQFVDSRFVVVQRSRIVRTRPRFPSWGCEFTVEIDDSVWNKEEFILALNAAGTLCGVGDLRPNKNGRYGTFDVNVTAI